MTALPATSHPAGRPLGMRRIAPTLPRAAAFWLVAATVTALLAASSAPSPLYAVYQAEFGFSSATLTAVFAVYVLALLVSLLTVGRLSDFVGRRPVLVIALFVEAAAMAVFLGADDVTALLVARIVQGLATGAAIGVLGAYLLDLQPPDGSRLGSLLNSVAATGGLGVGAVLAGVLLQYAPQPTRLIFEVLVLSFLILAAATAVLPETVRSRPGALAALRPRVSVPATARSAFLRSMPTLISTWMLGGLMLSVGGSLLANVFGQHNHAVVGVVLGAFAGAAALACTLLRNRSPEFMSILGSGLLVVGTLAVVLSVATTSAVVFVAGTVVAGSGFGPAFLGAFRSVSQLAADHERAGLISAVFIASYLAFSIPAVVAGIVIGVVGLALTTIGYAVLVSVVATATLMVQVLARRRVG